MAYCIIYRLVYSLALVVSARRAESVVEQGLPQHHARVCLSTELLAHLLADLFDLLLVLSEVRE